MIERAPLPSTSDPASEAASHRPMTVADLDAVMAIEAVAYSHPWSRGNFIDSLAAGYWTVLRLGPAGELLAYAVAMPVLDEAHLLNLTVTPSQQGRGHARALLDCLGRHMQAHQLRTMWLEVRPSNLRARRLYAAQGFAEVGLRRGYYPAGQGRREDAIVMSRALPAVEPDAGHAGPFAAGGSSPLSHALD